MAKQQSHVSMSLFLGIVYALSGIIFFRLYLETAVLGLTIMIIAGLLPDVDAPDGPQAKELAGLFSAFVPVFIFVKFPDLITDGLVRASLVTIITFLTTRGIIGALLSNNTQRRGMIHSVPSAIIAFEIVYIIFSELFWKERLFLSGAALIGFLAHLLLDAGSDVDSQGKALGDRQKQMTPIKFSGPSTGSTLALYGSLFALGWLIIKDLEKPLVYMLRTLGS